MEIGAHICAEKLSVTLSVLISINMGVSNTLGCNVLKHRHFLACSKLYDLHTMSQPRNMNYGITCLSNGWNYVNICLNDVLT